MSSSEFGSAVVRKAHQYKWVDGLQFINAIRQSFSTACERTKVERMCHALGRQIIKNDAPVTVWTSPRDPKNDRKVA